jgi:hypothetical protein
MLRDANSSFRYLVGLYATTFVHHIYGGIVFESAERIVLAAIFSAVFAATVWLHRLRRSRRWATYAYNAIVTVFWVGLLGLYEGGYNHTLFVLLRLADAPPPLVASLYPAGPGEGGAPDDVFFQATGVLTFVMALLVAFPLPRSRRPSHGVAPA